VSIPKYNRENRWYIEKYQSIGTLFGTVGAARFSHPSAGLSE